MERSTIFNGKNQPFLWLITNITMERSTIFNGKNQPFLWLITNITMERSTIFYGTNQLFLWPFSIAIYVCLPGRVIHTGMSRPSCSGYLSGDLSPLIQCSSLNGNWSIEFDVTKNSKVHGRFFSVFTLPKNGDFPWQKYVSKNQSVSRALVDPTDSLP